MSASNANTTWCQKWDKRQPTTATKEKEAIGGDPNGTKKATNRKEARSYCIRWLGQDDGGRATTLFWFRASNAICLSASRRMDSVISPLHETEASLVADRRRRWSSGRCSNLLLEGRRGRHSRSSDAVGGRQGELWKSGRCVPESFCCQKGRQNGSANK